MLYELLPKYKSAIVTKWVKLILDSYSTESSNFLSCEKNHFSNPVGSIISANAKGIFDEIIDGRNISKITLLLNDIVRIRAVQEFPPSEGVGFMMILKNVIKEELGPEINQEKIFDEFTELETVIDKIALIAFDLYMESREKVFQIRMNEVKYRLQKAVNNLASI